MARAAVTIARMAEMDDKPQPPSLPYGPLLTRLLQPLQRGLLLVNRALMAPLLRRGWGWMLGSPATGYLMLLRTHGSRSGIQREAPLGYVIRNGATYCVAGYGESTPWYRNLLADPAVEVVLPARRFHARAEPVTDPGEWLAAYRELLESFGIIGRVVIGDIRDLDDATLLARHRGLPVVRITPVDGTGALVAGPFDPGGSGWVIPYAAWGVLTVLAWSRFARRRRAPRR